MERKEEFRQGKNQEEGLTITIFSLKKYYWLPVLFLTVFMIFSMAVGCGSTDDESVSDNGTAENGVSEIPDNDVDEDLEFAFDYWENPQDISELVELFKLLQFDISSRDQSSSIVYRFEGKETISGVETSRVTMEMHSNGQAEMSVTLWVDNNGKSVQIAFDDEILPGETAAMMAEPIFSIAFMPFNLVKAYDPEVVLTDRHPNIKVESKSTSSETFGNLSGKIYETVISVTSLGNEYQVKWNIGDFGNLQMMTLYETLDVSEDEDFKYELTNVELR